MKTSDTIGFVSLIVTIITGIIFPFIQRPFLGYEVTQPLETSKKNVETFKVIIHNYGIVAAKNVIASLSADNVRFLEFVSKPYMSRQFVVDNTTTSGYTGNGFFKIDVLPPQSTLVVFVKMDTSKNYLNQPLIVYVSSDE